MQWTWLWLWAIETVSKKINTWPLAAFTAKTHGYTQAAIHAINSPQLSNYLGDTRALVANVVRKQL